MLELKKKYSEKVGWEAHNIFNYNHKQADFVFHANSNEPVVQFFSETIYTYIKPIPKEEQEASDNSNDKVIYMMQKDGTIKQIKLE